MKIIIEDIPDEGLVVDLSEKVSLGDTGEPAQVQARLDVSKTGQEVIIAGSLRAGLQLQCSRCLRDFQSDLEIPISVVYHPLAESAAADRRELKGDEMDMDYYREEIDVEELFREQILLNTQMKPLCSEQCRGLCPHCGTDLNVSDCSCSTKQADPRLEVLRKLLEKGKE